MGNCLSILKFYFMGNFLQNPTPSIEAIESIKEMYQQTDPEEQIDPLTRFVENQLHKINSPSEAGSSSIEGWLETVRDGTETAAKTIDIISTEAGKLSKWGDAVERLTLQVVEGVGEVYWVVIGLSVAAFAVGRYMSVGCTQRECRELLLEMLELSKAVEQCSQRDERGQVGKAVATIVEGAVLCCDYLERGEFVRFWSAMTAAAQIEKTKQQLSDVRYSLQLLDLLQLWDKDVFLSHSGRQKNFVRQLHRDMKNAHVSCFFDEDDNSLPLGKKFPRLIFKAAETCRIAVVVLSKEFILSKWPMLELSAFIKAKNSGKNAKLEILPIFFRITPKELSHYTKDSPEWKELVKNNETRVEWQNALKEVRSINGLLFGEGGNAVECRDKVVKKVCDLLKRNNPPELLRFEPVGIEEPVQKVKELLEMESDASALAVIVCGFGGVGKTTLADFVVESLDWSSTEFKFCRVTIDEKTPDERYHIMTLQRNILDYLGGVKLELQDPDDGLRKITKALSKRRSLLYIDNVVDKNYIPYLLPDLRSAEQGTKLRIIITSREKNLRPELQKPIMCKEYEVQVLCDTASRSLLSKTILDREVVNFHEEESLINEVAAACRGVPLLLSVFGKHLKAERDKNSYEEVLKILKEGDLEYYRDENLGKRLLFVYDKIKNLEVKKAFLDICTYFHGWEWNLVADIVDSSILDDLCKRMLVSESHSHLDDMVRRGMQISESGSGRVIVHDILRLMGEKKARSTRFSDWEKLSDALEDNLDGLRNVEGIWLVNDRRLITIKSTQLEAMHQSLRVLMLGDWVKLDGPPCRKAFRNLRYLRVGDINAFPFKDLSKLDKLNVFVNGSKPGMNLSHLPSSLKRITHHLPQVECDEFAKLPLQNLNSLKSFVVERGVSVELPKELRLPASLLQLDLSGCKNLPEDIGHLTALESLILDGSDLERLPQGIDKLQQLKHFSMNFCSKLDFWSEEFVMLPSLEALSMMNCTNLRALPKSLGALPSLQKLELRGCSKLQLLPESLGQLRIGKLRLGELRNLQELPKSLGIMPYLKCLSLYDCLSLMSLPDSFVQLKMLQTLEISNCPELRILPKDFGLLKSLEQMTVQFCPLLKELPHGFGALAALKIFALSRCNSFVNLSTDLTELTSLEVLYLEGLPLITRIPDGFGKLERLRCLLVDGCFQLKTLSDDFEKLATLEHLSIRSCSELDGAMMEKILKLQHCDVVDIDGSRKLLEKWRHMRSEIEHPITVLGEEYSSGAQENRERAIRDALLNGKCMELINPSDPLVERSSLFEGLEEGTTATLALISLPVKMHSYYHLTVMRFVEMARERVATTGSCRLQIVFVRKYEWTAQSPTPTEEEEEEEGFRQIVVSLRKGSSGIPSSESICLIPSSESKRVKIITLCCDWEFYKSGDIIWFNKQYYWEISFFMANVRVDVEGRKSFENFKFMDRDEIRFKDEATDGTRNSHHSCFQKFIDSIIQKGQCQSQCVAGQSKTTEFIQGLKDHEIEYLLIEGQQVMVDNLHGKTIGFIICSHKDIESIKLLQIYKDIRQKDSNFIGIWIPDGDGIGSYKGIGSYTRLIQGKPWATFPHPEAVILSHWWSSDFVVLDKGGIANKNALYLLLGWGAKLYPFTRHIIRESFFFMESEPCLESLLHGMNIVGRKPIKNKITFLYFARLGEWVEMKCKLEELTKIHGNFEVLYVGRKWDGEEQAYEDATQKMQWPSLSFSDKIKFWHRIYYMWKEGDELSKESNIMMETVLGLAEQLSDTSCLGNSLVVVDNNGAVTRRGEDVLQMICEGEGKVRDELMKSLSRGECSPEVKTFFKDEIDHHPQHPQHRIVSYPSLRDLYYLCGVCFKSRHEISDGGREYRCERDGCRWWMCGSCWKAYAIQQVEQLLRAKDD